MVNLSPVKRDMKMEVDSDQTADIHQRTSCFQLIQKFTKEVQCTHHMEQKCGLKIIHKGILKRIFPIFYRKLFLNLKKINMFGNQI